MNQIVQYVRDVTNKNPGRKRDKRGVVLAKNIGPMVVIGWSYTNTDAGDVFEKNFGLHRANEVADKGTTAQVPREVEKVVNQVAAQAREKFGTRLVFCQGKFPPGRDPEVKALTE